MSAPAAFPQQGLDELRIGGLPTRLPQAVLEKRACARPCPYLGRDPFLHRLDLVGRRVFGQEMDNPDTERIHGTIERLSMRRQHVLNFAGRNR